MLNETIDVLIPVYNCEKYLSICLDSLISQTYKNLRIVLVDDGSTDKSIDILNEYAKKHKNIEVYQKQNEASISKTRNFLLKQIKSEYFSFFDSDDYAEPTYFETLYKNIKNYKADVSICGKIRHKENKKVNFEKFNKHQNSTTLFNKQECLAEMLSSNLFNGTVYSKLFKSTLLKNITFDPQIHYGEDLDFCFKIMQNANKFVFTKKKLYHYIIRKNSIVTSKFNEKKLTCIDCYDNIIKQLNNNQELLIAAKSMQGLIAIEILYYTWRDKFKNKQIKSNLKKMIKESIPFIKKNTRLSKLYRCTPAVWWLTKFM